MLPTIETFERPAAGAAVSWAGSDHPAFVVPFPGCELRGAFALDLDTVLFAGVRDALGAVAPLLLALYHLPTGRVVLRREVAGYPKAFLRLARDRSRLLVSGQRGLAVVDATTLEPVARCEFQRWAGGCATYVPASADDLKYSKDPAALARARERAAAGWHRMLVQFAYQVGEIDPARLILVQRWPNPVAPGSDQKEQRYEVIDWRAGTGHPVMFRSEQRPTALDCLDPGADLLHVARDQLALFRASPPRSTAEPGPFACSDPSLHAVVLILWRLGGDAPPHAIVVREAGAEAWLASDRRRLWSEKDDSEKLRPMREAVLLRSPEAEVAQPALWSAAAANFLVSVYEDPRDGLLWLSFADNHIRSLDGAGALGPLIRLGGTPNVPDDDPHRRRPGPEISFQSEDVVVKVRGTRYGDKMARYAFRASDVAGRTSPVTLMPARPGPLPGSHAKAFAAHVRAARRDRFALPDWGRDSVAAALVAQRAAVAAGLPDLVDPEEDRLTFSYRVAGRPVKEAAFFRRIARDALPVVPELRALLLVYTGALGAGGDGVQPWQDPDEGVGGLGPALHALALLDPDCLDVLRAYLETRDGEHEGFCLDTVVPAFFKRHGWRDADAVRFGIHATLNRSWGGRHPPEGFAGMTKAMARLLTPGKAVEAVLREAEHFGGKPDRGYDAAAYRAAFCSLLSPADPFEAAVLDGIAGDPAEA